MLHILGHRRRKIRAETQRNLRGRSQQFFRPLVNTFLVTSAKGMYNDERRARDRYQMRNEGISFLNEQILLASNYLSPIFLRFFSYIVFFHIYIYMKQRQIIRIIGHNLSRRDTREFVYFIRIYDAADRTRSV